MVESAVREAADWRETHVDHLKRLWDLGLSASQIAAELYSEFGAPYSRNAVIGKVHRKGWQGRSKDAKRTGGAKRRTVRLVTHIPPRPRSQGNAALAHAFEAEPTVAPAPPDNVVPLHQRKTLLELTADSCRWPIGDPARDDFFFCGGRSIEGLPYCPKHARVAYQSPAERQRKRRGHGG